MEVIIAIIISYKMIITRRKIDFGVHDAVQPGLPDLHDAQNMVGRRCWAAGTSGGNLFLLRRVPQLV